MAAEFIGSTILVTLYSPPDAQVQGVVADIVGQDLTLQNGKNLTTIHLPGGLHVEQSSGLPLAGVARISL